MVTIERTFIFFFQAEDGIRDHCVTGVQTCALPIFSGRLFLGGHSYGGRQASMLAAEQQIGRASWRERGSTSAHSAASKKNRFRSTCTKSCYAALRTSLKAVRSPDSCRFRTSETDS